MNEQYIIINKNIRSWERYPQIIQPKTVEELSFNSIKMAKCFIIESASYSNFKIIEEHANYIVFQATLQEADAFNRNGRKYPKSVLEHALSSPYIRERLRTHSWVGEAGHPLDDSDKRQMAIMHNNLSHNIRKIWWEGNLLKAEIETCDTVVGHEMMGLIKQGMQVAFSLRAQGEVSRLPDGKILVCEPLHILTYDWVINPSHDKAFMDSMQEEAKTIMWRDPLSTACLMESATLFENGQLFETDKPMIINHKNYATKGRQKFLLKEDVVPAEIATDANVEISDDMIFADVVKDDTQSTVMLNDLLDREICNKLINLFGSEAE